MREADETPETVFIASNYKINKSSGFLFDKIVMVLADFGMFRRLLRPKLQPTTRG